jgi:hypothetical protein
MSAMNTRPVASRGADIPRDFRFGIFYVGEVRGEEVLVADALLVAGR